MPPPVKPYSCFTHSLTEKATYFAHIFDSKQSDENFISLYCVFLSLSLSFAFLPSEIKKLLLDFDLFGGVDPNGIFFFFFFFFLQKLTILWLPKF